MISTVVLGLTIGCILFGFLLGLMRGFNRSILRLILVAACFAAAWFLKDVFVDLLLKVEVGGQTIEQLLTSSLLGEGSGVPQKLLDLVLVLMEILVSVVLFLLSFIVFKFVSWTIIFPICKIFVKKGKKKRALLGGVVGIVQGAFVAFALCFPLTGLLIQVNQIAVAVSDVDFSSLTASVDDESVRVLAEEDEKNGVATYFYTENGNRLELYDSSSEEESSASLSLGLEGTLDNIGLADFEESFIGKFYAKVGGGLYTKMTTAKDRDGKELNLDTTVNAVVCMLKMVDKISVIQELDMSDGLTLENSKQLAQTLRELDDIKGEMNEETKQMVSDIIKDTVSSLGGDESESIFPEDFDFSTVEFGAAADAIDAVTEYKEANEGEKSAELTSEQAKQIAEGLAKNDSIMDVIGEDSNLMGELSESEKQTMRDAINKTDASPEKKEQLMKMLGATPAETTDESESE